MLLIYKLLNLNTVLQLGANILAHYHQRGDFRPLVFHRCHAPLNLDVRDYPPVIRSPRVPGPRRSPCRRVLGTNLCEAPWTAAGARACLTR